jgi:hypothetical protein
MSLLKPTIQMPFHIDFDWWEQNDSDWRVFLRTLLCPEHQEALADVQEGALVDWVDPRTAEVQQVEGIQHALMTHCALQPDFVDPHTAVVEAVFRLFLASGNQPMSAVDMGKRLNRPAETILRTLAGPRVYRGIRPVIAARPEEPVAEVEAPKA